MKRLTIPLLLLVVAVAGCGTPSSDPTTSSSTSSTSTTAGGTATSSAPPATGASAAPDTPIPRCEDVPRITPDVDVTGGPIYVGNEQQADQVDAWASTKPGFEALWVDRELNGWVVVAFSADADDRRREVAELWPDGGVAVVEVDWTEAELAELQRRVVDELSPLFPVAVGRGLMKGTVSISIGVMTPERLAAVEQFAGQRVCIEGTDPAASPEPGPQPTEGEGWILLADQLVGHPYRTGIATDRDQLATLWEEVGFEGAVPEVDFDRHVVVWFGAVYGSSCPDIRLDDVTVTGNTLHSVIVLVDPPPVCTADANARAFLVAVERSSLPEAPFRIQLQAAEPPGGATEERTVVTVDLRRPGIVAPPSAITTEAPKVVSNVSSGGFVEPGFPFSYLIYTHCGTEWFGELNGIMWRAIDAPTPQEWVELFSDTETLEVEAILTEGPAPTIIATAGGVSVIYVPAEVEPPGCD